MLPPAYARYQISDRDLSLSSPSNRDGDLYFPLFAIAFFRNLQSRCAYLVSFLLGVMASELGLDFKLARRIGLLHDIGKAIDHQVEGTHAKLGAELAKKYNEIPEVQAAIEAHHEEAEPKSLYAVLAIAADAISATRPGARRETLETYVKRLEKLESIANLFKGVEKSFAIQAGREIRVIVQPEKISDSDAISLSRDIRKKIEEGMEYPGQIKVTVIRETRAIEYAK